MEDHNENPKFIEIKIVEYIIHLPQLQLLGRSELGPGERLLASLDRWRTGVDVTALRPGLEGGGGR